MKSSSLRYTYDAVSRLNDLKLDFAGTTDDLTSAFAYNPASQIAGNTRSNDAYAWTSHGSGTTSTTSNGRNQIAGWVNTLSYDTKGNVTVDGTYTYGYSSENLLTSLANSATGAVQPTIAFAYDPLMRLAVIDSSNSGFDVDFGYDGQEMVLEGLSSSRTRRYVYGPGVDEPLVGYLVTPGVGTSRLWYHADERGSIARLSNDAGTPGGIGKFDEYGIGGTSRFRFTGQYWLGEANLLYYRARVYDARLGRFLQPDPIGYGAGMNMYAYVGGDPVNFTDPLGLCSAGQVRMKDSIGTPGMDDGDGGIIIQGRYFCVNMPSSGSSGSGSSGSRLGFGDDNGSTQCYIPQVGCVRDRWGEGGPQGPQPIPPKADPNPDKRRDGCGNPLPPASRQYSLPPGYSRYVDPQNRTVKDPYGKTVNNPYYQHAFNAASGIDVRGVASDLAWIGFRVAESLTTGFVMRSIWGNSKGGAIMAGNRVVSSGGEAGHNPGGPCSR